MGVVRVAVYSTLLQGSKRLSHVPPLLVPHFLAIRPRNINSTYDRASYTLDLGSVTCTENP